MVRTRNLQRMPSCPQMPNGPPHYPTPHQSLHGMLNQEQRGSRTEVQIEDENKDFSKQDKGATIGFSSGIHINMKRAQFRWVAINCTEYKCAADVVIHGNTFLSN